VFEIKNKPIKSALRISLRVYLLEIFETSGKWFEKDENEQYKRYPDNELKKESGMWDSIFTEIHMHSQIIWPEKKKLSSSKTARSKNTRSIGEELLKSFSKGEGKEEAAFAFYYWLHTFNKDIGQGEFPFKSKAYEIDELFFGERLEVTEAKVLNVSGNNKSPAVEEEQVGGQAQLNKEQELELNTTAMMKNGIKAAETVTISVSNDADPEVNTLQKIYLENKALFQIIFIVCTCVVASFMFKSATSDLISLSTNFMKNSDFKVELSSNKTTYSIGDELEVFFSANRSFYARVFYIDSNGKCLYLKAINENEAYQPNKEYKLKMHPTEPIRVGEPKGKDEVKILASTSLEKLKGESKLVCGSRSPNIPTYNSPNINHSNGVSASTSIEINIM